MGADMANGTVGGFLKDSDVGVDVSRSPENGSVNGKKSKDVERRRRRRKQKKKNKAANGTQIDTDSEGEGAEHERKENNKMAEHVEVEYVSEKAFLEDDFIEDFKNVFEKFTFGDAVTTAKKDDEARQEAASNMAAKKKADSDSEEEDEQEKQRKDKGLSNKKKKLQRRMKIAELKQMCSRPDVVEVWDATAADPKLLVFLKSYRNTVPVPRHWCQKRKFLQGAVHQQW